MEDGRLERDELWKGLVETGSRKKGFGILSVCVCVGGGRRMVDLVVRGTDHVLEVRRKSHVSVILVNDLLRAAATRSL